MKRVAVVLAILGLVGFAATGASAQTPAVASLSMQTAAATVGHVFGPVHWYGRYWGPYYAVPRVAVVPYAAAPVYVAPPPPAYVAPVVPYYYPPPAVYYYGRPRLSVGVAF